MRPIDISLSLEVTVSKRPWSPRRLVTGAGRRLIVLAVLSLAGIFFLVPIVWLLLEPTKSSLDMLGGTPLHFGSFSVLQAWWDELFSPSSTYLSPGPIVPWLKNSALYSGSGVALAVVLGIPAGYGLATFEFAGRRLLLIVTMIAMLIPSNALVLPLILEANSVHMTRSPFAVILPYGLFPFGVYMAYLYFNTPSTHHLIASARIDGASEWQAFRRVALPLSMPIIGLIALLDFVASWTNYFLPFLMYWPSNTSGRYPVSVGIGLQLIQPPPTTSGTYLANLDLALTTPAPEEALLLLVSVAPVIVVLVIAQRWIGSGRSQGVFGG